MKESKHVYMRKETEKMLQRVRAHFGCSSDSEAVRLSILKTFEGVDKV